MKLIFLMCILWLMGILPLFAVNYTSQTLREDDIEWYNPAEDSQFRVYGLYTPDKEHPYYYRVPEYVTEPDTPILTLLSKHTAGGRVRFVTDSPYIAVHSVQHAGIPRTNLTLTFSNGFDIYTKGKKGKETYEGTYMPPAVSYDGFDGIIYINKGLCTVTLNTPRYGGVKEMYIGLRKGSRLERAADYRIEKPMVFYGSSITQGECASRPGNTYEDILCRELDCNYINLGFSGSARGEQHIADYIASLDMSLFVLDYDHNAPDPEHLRNTHYNFYSTVRRAHPGMPIIMITRPNPVLTEDNKARLEVVTATYDRARKEGDRNVYLVKGHQFMTGYSRDSWTIDNTHPNDFGMVLIAKKLQKVISPVLQK